MRFGQSLSRVLLLCVLLAPVCRGQVKLRWTQKKMPSAKSLGVSELAIPWNDGARALSETAHQQGYRVYLEVTDDQVAAAAELSRTSWLSGLILSSAANEKSPTENMLRALHAAHPKLDLVVLSPRGKQPQMRGQLVYERNGVLQASSPTEQPWVDSNLAAVRLAEVFHPESVPAYTFAWGAADSFQGQKGPGTADYCLAIGEAGAFHAELILELPEDLQKSLATNNPDAWAMWKQVKPCLVFNDHRNRNSLKPVSSVGVWTDNEASAYEAVNLMARHNIPVRVLPVGALSARSLNGLDVLIVFASPTEEQAGILSHFAEQGGTVVLVNAHGKFPWQPGKAARGNEQSVAYDVGQGRVFELTGAVTNPETFAQDVRRLMHKQKVPLTLWNSLTTLVVPYRDTATGETVLEFLNYEAEPVQVQIQVRGSFKSIRFESPERGCCEVVAGTFAKGFTEFVVSKLVIGGRLRLQPMLGAKTSRDRKKP